MRTVLVGRKEQERSNTLYICYYLLLKMCKDLNVLNVIFSMEQIPIKMLKLWLILILNNERIKHKVAFLRACILILEFYFQRVSPLISPWNQIRADTVIKCSEWCHLCRHMTSLNCALNISASSFITLLPAKKHTQEHAATETASGAAWRRGDINKCLKQKGVGALKC